MAQHHKLTQTINLKNLIAMKKLISFVLLALAFSSCDKLEADLHEAQFVDISVNTFTMEQEPLQSKSRISASESEATQIAIAIFDSADEKVYSAKVWRDTGEKWSRQSEELPLWRVLDLAILLTATIKGKESSLEELKRILG